MKKWFILMLAAALLLSTAALGESKTDYRTAGLEVTKIMGQIAADENYISLISGVGEIETIRETVNTGDYDRPAAVYELKLKDPRAFAESTMNENTRETWAKIPEELKEQALRRFNVQALCTMYTSRQGAAFVAFSSATVAVVPIEDLTAEESVCYLYTFEKGTPILVTFGYRGASGTFVFLPKEQCATPADLQTALPDLEITLVEE